MNIGFLSLGFAAVCAVGFLIGSAFLPEEPRRVEVDYRRIYADMMPREISREVRS